MAVYRFRVTFEDDDEIYRDVDIKSSQNFHELHSTILASIGFEDNCDASFFISDDVWRKGEEIALNPPKEETKDSKGKKKKLPAYMMRSCRLASLIDDPHQKFIYVHDIESPWTLTVELMKILPDDAKTVYPKCSKSVGLAPKKIQTPIVIPDIVDDEELDDIDEPQDNEVYASAGEGFDIGEVDEIETETEGEEEKEESEEDSELEEHETGEESFFDEE